MLFGPNAPRTGNGLESSDAGSSCFLAGTKVSKPQEKMSTESSGNKGEERGQWGSRMGFILAAAGSAVGLGNIWKFPYITGENGGGLFVLIYLACIALVGLPVMVAEIMIGRMSKASPVGAYSHLSPKGAEIKVWQLVGWMGVAAGFLILAFYSVVGGWTMHYIVHALKGAFAGLDSEHAVSMFGELAESAKLSVGWHIAFMCIVIGIVIGGVKKGIEVSAKVLMPALFVILLVLLFTAFKQPAFGEAFSFVFSPDSSKLTPSSILEALGHSFFTLSLGMGSLVTYGSYMSKNDDIMSTSFSISILDTVVALSACMIMFPITFSVGIEAEAGPGLVFQSLPIAFGQMPGGQILALVFFALLLFAAVTSAISMLEVVVATAVDLLGWKRKEATLLLGGVILVFGVGCALSVGGGLEFWTNIFGKSMFDSFDYITSNWLLPLGGLFIALFMGWRVERDVLKGELTVNGKTTAFFSLWLFLIRFVVPLAILIIIAVKAGLIKI